MNYIKEADHKGKKKLQDNTRSIIEEKKSRTWQENLFAVFKLEMIHYEYKFVVQIQLLNPQPK